MHLDYVVNRSVDLRQAQLKRAAALDSYHDTVVPVSEAMHLVADLERQLEQAIAQRERAITARREAWQRFEHRTEEVTRLTMMLEASICHAATEIRANERQASAYRGNRDGRRGALLEGMGA